MVLTISAFLRPGQIRVCCVCQLVNKKCSTSFDARCNHEEINKFLLKQGTRLINNETITNFQTQLEKKETWEAIYKDTCSNRMSIAYLCTFLKIFEASFPLKYKGTKEKKDWITQGIKISCKLKEIFISSLRTAMIKEQKCVIYYIL